MTKLTAAVAALAMMALFCSPVAAQTVIEDWSSVKPDAAPALKPVAVEAKTTALIVMDLLKQSCNEKRPRCVASIPKIKTLIAAAKAKDVLPEVAPPAGTSEVVAVADKFVHTDLEKMLKDKGITTIITVGTVAEGAVLFTASDAAMRGFKVVVPIEGLSSSSLYGEQVTAWTLAHAPTIAQNVTLTKMDMITYH